MKEKSIKITNETNEILEQHKIDTGRPITGMIQEAIYRWLVHEKLMVIRTVVIKREKVNKTPEELLYCDGPKCNT